MPAALFSEELLVKDIIALPLQEKNDGEREWIYSSTTSPDFKGSVRVRQTIGGEKIRIENWKLNGIFRISHYADKKGESFVFLALQPKIKVTRSTVELKEKAGSRDVVLIQDEQGKEFILIRDVESAFRPVSCKEQEQLDALMATGLELTK